MSVGCGCFVGRWNRESPLGGAQLAPLGHVLRLLLQGGEPLHATVVNRGQGALVVGGQDGWVEELLKGLHVTAVEVHLWGEEQNLYSMSKEI